MGTGIFITGTDTGVGKTRVAALLVRALRAAGTAAACVKLVSGDSDFRAEAEFAPSGTCLQFQP